jgi:hypothetical protein
MVMLPREARPTPAPAPRPPPPGAPLAARPLPATPPLNPLRRAGVSRELPRAVFIAHALLPGDLSTSCFSDRLEEHELTWPTERARDPGYVRWLSFPFVPRTGSRAQPVWVDFYMVPVLAPTFLRALKSPAPEWVERIAGHAIVEAEADDVPLTVGWGALTKMATGHGAGFLARYPQVGALSKVSTTHGDAGTTALVLEMLRLAELPRGGRIAILGAAGAIGDLVARSLGPLEPSRVVLVGRADAEGEDVKRRALEEVAARVRPAMPSAEVQVEQDKATACLRHRCHVVIVATSGMNLDPEEIPAGALVIDLTTPAACQPHPGWRSRLVLRGGSGQFQGLEAALPHGFGRILGKPRIDIGGGGPWSIWGCTIETIARASAGVFGHSVGLPIPADDLRLCRQLFDELRIAPPPPETFGQRVSWRDVRAFVRSQSPAGGRPIFFQRLVQLAGTARSAWGAAAHLVTAPLRMAEGSTPPVAAEAAAPPVASASRAIPAETTAHPPPAEAGETEARPDTQPTGDSMNSAHLYEQFVASYKATFDQFAQHPALQLILGAKLPLPYYKAFLRQHYHFVRQAPQIGGFAANYLRGKQRGMAAQILNHAMQDADHDAPQHLADLRALGEEVSRLPYENPAPTTAALLAFIHYQIQFVGPVAWVGHRYFLENILDNDGGFYKLARASGVPEEACSFLREHWTVESWKRAFWERCVRELITTDDELTIATYAMRATAQLFAGLIQGAYDLADQPFDYGPQIAELRLAPPNAL